MELVYAQGFSSRCRWHDYTVVFYGRDNNDTTCCLLWDIFMVPDKLVASARLGRGLFGLGLQLGGYSFYAQPWTQSQDH